MGQSSGNGHRSGISAAPRRGGADLGHGGLSGGVSSRRAGIAFVRCARCASRPGRADPSGSALAGKRPIRRRTITDALQRRLDVPAGIHAR